MKPVGAIDFETGPILPRPAYPPVPVGVALRSARWRKGKYYAWGHAEYATGRMSGMGNNCTRAEGIKALREFVRDHHVLCHHAGFDLDVAETHCGIAWPADHEDTLIAAFLVDPDSWSLSLKPLAERYLGMKPEEQDLLKEWIIEHVPEGAWKAIGQTKNEKTAGAMICHAPVKLVEPYAIGDVDRTLALWLKKFQPELRADDRFWAGYRREIKVTRTLIRMERRGVPVARARLKKDVPKYEATKRGIELTLLKRLKFKDREIDAIVNDYEGQDVFAWSGPKLAERLVRSKLVKALPLTEKGNPSTSAESLASVMDPKLAKEFEVRSQIATCINTFMKPWLKQAEGNADGLMFARFNQVRNGDEWGSKTGARTGRLSMTPNLQNVIRSDKDERVPILRDYITVLAKLYEVLGQRDYSQQELRLLAHFEGGPFLESYMKDPDQDGHELVRALIKQTTGIDLPRRPVKDLNFGLIYGQGLALTAEKMGIPRDEAKRMRKAHADSLPGLPELQATIKERVRNKEPIWTWGGRRYFCEPAIFKNGRRMSFEYKMLNKLIQGSAADVTKQAMINYDSLGTLADENPMILQVHDELIFGIQRKAIARKIHEAMRDAMLDVAGIAVPMKSDGKLGTVWHRMKKINW